MRLPNRPKAQHRGHPALLHSARSAGWMGNGHQRAWSHFLVEDEDAAPVPADAAVVGGGEDRQEHRVVLDLVAAHLPRQLVRADHRLHLVARAKGLGHVAPELDRVAAAVAAGDEPVAL
eukprot:5417650-Pleurochrysis_carterae.AAC.1